MLLSLLQLPLCVGTIIGTSLSPQASESVPAAVLFPSSASHLSRSGGASSHSCSQRVPVRLRFSPSASLCEWASFSLGCVRCLMVIHFCCAFLFSSAFPCFRVCLFCFCLSVCMLLLLFLFASSAWALLLASLQQQCLCDGYHVQGPACSSCFVVVGFLFLLCCFVLLVELVSSPLRPW